MLLTFQLDPSTRLSSPSFFQMIDPTAPTPAAAGSSVVHPAGMTNAKSFYIHLVALAAEAFNGFEWKDVSIDDHGLVRRAAPEGERAWLQLGQ